MVLNNSVDTDVKFRAYIKSRIVAATEKMIKPLQKLAEDLAEPRSLTYEELHFIGELVTSLIIASSPGQTKWLPYSKPKKPLEYDLAPVTEVEDQPIYPASGNEDFPSSPCLDAEDYYLTVFWNKCFYFIHFVVVLRWSTLNC